MLFKTIYADPPWRYNQAISRNGYARGGLPYPTLSTEEIIKLPVSSLCEEDAMCFLWSTNAHIHDALHVMESWGFEYKTMITWVKNNMGLGFWFRGKTEHLLFGVKGHPRSKYHGPHGAMAGMNFTTVFEAKKADHSRKPEYAYTIIEAISEEPRIELFARQTRPGWFSVGNEIDGKDIIQALPKPVETPLTNLEMF